MNNSANLDFFSQLDEPERLKRLTQRLTQKISRLKLGRRLRILEFCGGHTHVLLRHGIDETLSEVIEFVHGPGCPVCVIAQSRIDYALNLAEKEDIILATYGDLLRIPGSQGLTLQKLRALGRDVKMVDSSLATLKLAKDYPHRKIIFFAIGFETTTPHTAFLAKQIPQQGLKNLYLVSNHVISPIILAYLLEKGIHLDGIIAPGHVSAILGQSPWEEIAQKYHLPIVISGFEPFDLLTSLLLLVDAIEKETPTVLLQYDRVVRPEGNPLALSLIEEIFQVRETFPWRGFGLVPNSAYKFKEEWCFLDAEQIFPWEIKEENPKGCLCGDILQGKAKPWECKLFGKACTPKNPIGPCMVSGEGVCQAYFKYKLI